MVKVKEDMTGWIMSEHGFPNSRLTVLYQTNDYIDASEQHHAVYHCVCSCPAHNELDVRASNLRIGQTQSCGCIQKEIVAGIGRSHKKHNVYDLSGNYGVGWTSNTNQEFYFDLEDYDKIKDYCWLEHKMQGKEYSALETRDPVTKKSIRMSKLLGYQNYDHINKNTLDNRKCNFRKCTNSENTKNRNISKSNTSGFIGVSFNTRNQVWVARVNDKPGHRVAVYIGTNKQDAIRARLMAELKYYGEFAPQKHLFEEYGIKETSNE